MKNYINIIKKNINSNGVLLVRDRWWNKKNLEILKLNFLVEEYKCNYIEKSHSSCWYVCKKKI